MNTRVQPLGLHSTVAFLLYFIAIVLTPVKESFADACLCAYLKLEPVRCRNTHHAILKNNFSEGSVSVLLQWEIMTT